MVVNRNSWFSEEAAKWNSDRSALQTLYKVSDRATKENYFQGGTTHDWVDYYEKRIESDRSCLNEWHAMDNIESRRPPSPDSIRNKPTERNETEKVIRTTLKEIMMSVDLDEVTSKVIRSRLEEELDMDLGEYKSFIDQEMLVILGQMDAPTEVFEHVYLGSEWNASNYEELQKNGVGHILNVTREIDNFFPGTFDYLNVRVYDDEKTDLLKHWDDTFKYITRAKECGSKVLVHCKMGVSRSASVVIAYAMKACNWDFHKALNHVKEKRNCIKPNTNFLSQLETYQGILDAMRNKEKLQRSKSETNLNTPSTTTPGTTTSNKITHKIINNNNVNNVNKTVTDSTLLTTTKSVMSSTSQAKTSQVMATAKKASVVDVVANVEASVSGRELRLVGARPKSWSPDNLAIRQLRIDEEVDVVAKSSPVSLSLEDLSQKEQSHNGGCGLARHVLMPCDNGESYSVSPNQIVHLHDSGLFQRVEERKIISQNDTSSSSSGKKVVTNLVTRFGTDNITTTTTNLRDNTAKSSINNTSSLVANSTTTNNPSDDTASWDPGECGNTALPDDNVINFGETCDDATNSGCDQSNNVVVQTFNQFVNAGDDHDRLLLKNSDQPQQVWTCSAVVKNCSVIVGSAVADDDGVDETMVHDWNRDGGVVVDPFSNQLDRVFDKEEKKQKRVSVIPVVTQNVSDLSADDRPHKRDCPSRQSSWSSYDSAVVMGFHEPTELSRHSSWGSGDTRTLPSRNSSWGSYDMRPRGSVYYNNEKGEKVLHSTSDLLESSMSGLFPYDKEDIPWHPGTVKRTKQRLESTSSSASTNKTNSNNSLIKTNSSETLMFDCSAINQSEKENNQNVVEAFNEALLETARTVEDLQPSAIQLDNEKITARLSISAPEQSSMELIPQECLSQSVSNISDITASGNSSTNTQNNSFSVRQHRRFLESLHNRPVITEPNTSDNNSSCSSGIVRNLKKEFEAKSVNNSDVSGDSSISDPNKVKKNRLNNSLPSSPVSHHQTKEQKSDDMNFKNLLGLFETNKVVLRQKSGNNKSSTRHSCIEVSSTFRQHQPPTRIAQTPLISNLNKGITVNRGGATNESKRPPTGPAGVRNIAATVITAAAAKKQQQQYGKSHPLAKLNLGKSRHNNPVYNTM